MDTHLNRNEPHGDDHDDIYWAAIYSHQARLIQCQHILELFPLPMDMCVYIDNVPPRTAFAVMWGACVFRWNCELCRLDLLLLLGYTKLKGHGGDSWLTHSIFFDFFLMPVGYLFPKYHVLSCHLSLQVLCILIFIITFMCRQAYRCLIYLLNIEGLFNNTYVAFVNLLPEHVLWFIIPKACTWSYQNDCVDILAAFL
jgi:hypothetical protein